MSMPQPISQYLRQADIDFNILKHKPVLELADAARLAAIPLQQLVCSTIVQARWVDAQLVMVLHPASHKLDINRVSACLGGVYSQTPKSGLKHLFDGCDSGVIPALGQPFELMMLVDQQLFEQPHLYLEDGDNTELIKLDQSQFSQLMATALRGSLCPSN